MRQLLRQDAGAEVPHGYKKRIALGLRGNGKYAEATWAFAKLGNYEDSEKLYADTREKWVKQQKKKFEQAVISFVDYSKGSTYIPLLMDYFEVQDIRPDFSKIVFFDDLWSKAYRRADAVNHPKGTFNISYELLIDKRNLGRNEKNQNQVDDKELESFFKENITKFPLYYSTPASREYIAMDGKYLTEISIDSELQAMLKEKLFTDNLCYLGNSEGWVDLKFQEL
jgi:CRISPR-associated protein Cas5